MTNGSGKNRVSLKRKNRNKIDFKKDKNKKWTVQYKQYLNASKRVPRSLLTKVERNSQGKVQLRRILGENEVLNNPKPVGLIKHLLEFSTDADSLVVDFFAGSGTTAQAVLELNREDDGNRRFVMVQLPEPTPEGSIAKNAGYDTIADIGKKRVRRVLANMQEDNECVESADLGVKIFKLTESNYQPWNGVSEDSPESYVEQIRAFSDNPLIEDWDSRKRDL